MPAPVGELVYESSTAALRFDQARRLSLSRPGLSSLGPRATRSGLGTGRASAINTRSTALSVPVRSAGVTLTVPTVVGWGATITQSGWTASVGLVRAGGVATITPAVPSTSFVSAVAEDTCDADGKPLPDLEALPAAIAEIDTRAVN